MDSTELALSVRRVVRRHMAAGVDQAEAEDCVQEAVVALLSATGGASRIACPEAWLTAVSRRRLIDHARRARREQTALARAQTCEPHIVDDPGETVTDRAQARWMTAELSALPASTRRVCALLAEGASPQQVATELGLTTRAVESHLVRARRFLRDRAVSTLAVGA